MNYSHTPGFKPFIVNVKEMCLLAAYLFPVFHSFQRKHTVLAMSVQILKLAVKDKN